MCVRKFIKNNLWVQVDMVQQNSQVGLLMIHCLEKKPTLMVLQHINMISVESCEEWSNGYWKFSVDITGINYIWKYIQIENSYFKL